MPKHGEDVGLNAGVKNERGAVLLLVAAFMTIFLVGAALAVDLTVLASRGQTLQNTADAASLAGVVEYQQQLVNGQTEAQARAAAEDVIRDIVAQNDVDLNDPDILPTIEFDPLAGLVTVSILDDDPDSFLSGVVGTDSKVTRSATAEFVPCNDLCNIEIKLPKPFSAVSAAGDGDGYKPIPIGDDKVYAINHNSPAKQIVCVDRVEEEGCWVDTDGAPGVARSAYSGAVGYQDRNPEMPHTGVVGSKIFWSATDPDDGHKLFCWETATDTPCSTAITVGTDLRIDENNSPLTNDKDENRGGGTFALQNKVFVFTDNHEIHCYDALNNVYCDGYTERAYGGMPTALDAFPDNDPMDGNHGSSIDRIVDSSTGYVYSTIHVVAEASGSFTCAESLANPSGERVVIRNVETGAYLASFGPDNVSASFDGMDSASWWDVTDADLDSRYFQSVGTGEYLDGETNPPETSVAAGEDDEWNLTFDVDAWLIENEDFFGFLTDDSIQITKEDPAVPASRWEILPFQCGDPTVTGTPAHYGPGTWLHCYDTGVFSGVPAPCTGFEAKQLSGAPGPIHDDSSRFSGRLWFFYNQGGQAAIETGVCSSGYGAAGTVASIEINCVELGSGDHSAFMTNEMSVVRDAIRNSTGNSPGAWGDPHWNKFQNRLFYPTEHNTSLIICWDFDSGWCGSIEGEVPPNPSGETKTEDYGFFSEEDCVYALGHHALLWAFRASDINEPCVGSTSTTPIQKCPCGAASFRWGVLDFTPVDLDQYDVFNIQITTSPKNDADPTNDNDVPIVLFPANGSEYSLKPGGANPILDLDVTAGIDPAIEWIEVKVYAETQIDPILLTDAVYTVTFRQLPRLIE